LAALVADRSVAEFAAMLWQIAAHRRLKRLPRASLETPQA